MFDKASRLKLRFSTQKGLVTVEDLWDLPLSSTTNNAANLDDIAKDLFTQLKDTSISFVKKEQKCSEVIKLKFDVVKHVIDTKLAEQEAAEVKAVNKEKKQQLLALIAQKENDKLAGTSLEELRKMVDDL